MSRRAFRRFSSLRDQQRRLLQRRYWVESLERRVLLTFGDLDPLFSGDGLLPFNFASTDTARATLVQPDGKILVAGTWDGGLPDFALARFNPDGTLDTTFGGGSFGPGTGKTNCSFAAGFGGNEFAMDMALQGNGSIVLVGYTNNVGGVAAVGGQDFAIARFTATGVLDATFSGDGLFTADFGADDRASGVAIRSDGDIVVGGSADGGSSDFAVLRLNSNGTLDAGFDLDGRFTFTFGALDFCNDIALQSDNKIVMVGYTSSFAVTINDMAVARVNANGGLDLTYDVDGLQTIEFGNDDRANGVAIDPLGRAVIAGSWDGGSSDYAIARLTAVGALDVSFSGDGRANATFGGGVFGGAEFAQDLVLRPDGDIEVVGYTDATVEGGASGATNNFGVLRLNSDGSFDNTFDGNGRKLIDFGGDDLAYSVARDQDGTLILAGITGVDFAIARLRGALDIGFNAGGIQKTNYGATDTGNAVLVQPDGKILVAGSWDGGASDFALARYTAAGALDPAFGGGFYGFGSGLTNATFGVGVFGAEEFATDMALQPDGKIILVGYTNNVGGVATAGLFDLAVARFTSTGALDATFSGDGLFTFNFALTNDDRATGVAVRPNGKIIIGGFTDGGASDFVVLQLNSNGTPDLTFNGNGWNFGPTFSGDPHFARDLALQTDGRVVLAGDTDPAGADVSDIVVARFDINGNADPSFDADGFVTRAGASTETGNGVVVDQFGRIVVVGNNISDIVTLGFRSTGADDPAYNHSFAFGTTELGTDIAIQPDGKFVIAGYSSAITVNDFAAVRLNANGSVDTTFELFGTTNGFSFGDRVLIDLGGDDRAFGVDVQPNGKILLAGTSNGDFAVARLSARMAVASTVFEFETQHRLLVQFTAPFAGLATTDFTLENTTTTTIIPSGTIALANLGNGLAQLTFPGQSNQGIATLLPDGFYELTLPAGALTDGAGNPNVGALSFKFFFKMADANRNGSVTSDDFNILATNFGLAGKTFSQGNFNYSGGGVVNSDDFNLLATLFGTSLGPVSSVLRTDETLRPNPIVRAVEFGSNRILATEEEDALAILE
jgi:uncharacterized delta-60 repeat protein